MRSMDESFSDEEEKLYRAVKPEGMYIKEDGSISSAAFKSSNGCSVDRGDYRDDVEAANFMKQKLQGDVYKFRVMDCNIKQIFMQYDPQANDEFHTNLFKNCSLEKMTSAQCKYLASVASKVQT